jgi:hypothetical protein
MVDVSLAGAEPAGVLSVDRLWPRLTTIWGLAVDVLTRSPFSYMSYSLCPTYYRDSTSAFQSIGYLSARSPRHYLPLGAPRGGGGLTTAVPAGACDLAG